MKVLYFMLLLMPVSMLFFDSNSLGEAAFEFDTARFNSRLNEVQSMISKNSKYNQEVAFFIDMKVKSGKNRFYVYDLKSDKILHQGMVAHGSGSETSVKGILKFSNVINSKSTSLGTYSVGKQYYGKFGKAYRLHGLEETNSNAFVRSIVLHHYTAVPFAEQDYYIVNSQGCPMVNELFFKKLSKIIDASKQDILLDIYY